MFRVNPDVVILVVNAYRVSMKIGNEAAVLPLKIVPTPKLDVVMIITAGPVGENIPSVVS
jgi:hypothetical protein